MGAVAQLNSDCNGGKRYAKHECYLKPLEMFGVDDDGN